MALLFRDGDYLPDGKGGFRAASGSQEVLERVLWKLSVRRGSFPFLPGLGSRLHLLGAAPAGQREALAGQYVREALSDEDVTVTAVELAGTEAGRAAVTVRLDWRGESLTATVELGGLT